MLLPDDVTSTLTSSSITSRWTILSSCALSHATSTLPQFLPRESASTSWSDFIMTVVAYPYAADTDSKCDNWRGLKEAAVLSRLYVSKSGFCDCDSNFRHSCYPDRCTVLLFPVPANFRGNIISSSHTPHSPQGFPRSSIFAFVRRCRAHQLVQPKVSPSWLLDLLCCTLNSKGRMLIGHDIIFVIGIYRLVLWWNVDFFSRQLEA